MFGLVGYPETRAGVGLVGYPQPPPGFGLVGPLYPGEQRNDQRVLNHLYAYGDLLDRDDRQRRLLEALAETSPARPVQSAYGALAVPGDTYTVMSAQPPAPVDKAAAAQPSVAEDVLKAAGSGLVTGAHSLAGIGGDVETIIQHGGNFIDNAIRSALGAGPAPEPMGKTLLPTTEDAIAATAGIRRGTSRKRR